MKKYVIGLCVVLLVVGSVRTVAQTEAPEDIVVTNFTYVVNDVSARVNPVLDNNGEACAVIKFSVRDTTFVIESNLGIVKRESKVGEIRLWVPAGTKRLTVRHEGLFPLRDFQIPVTIESKGAYHAYIWRTDGTPPTPITETIEKKDTAKIEPPIIVEPPVPVEEQPVDSQPHKQDGVTQTKFNLVPGFMIIPQTGLSLAMGISANHHVVEVGAAMALNKTDSLYYYNNTTKLGTYQYRLMKAFVRYGYENRTKGEVAFAYTPMVGVQGVLSLGSGDEYTENETTKVHKLKDGMAISVSAAVRLALCLGEFSLYVKPEFNITAFKSDSYKLMMQGSDVFKKWTEGFALEAGFMITF